jgi:mannose-6-phosphate isomerase-like protein (cupin superfamily)
VLTSFRTLRSLEAAVTVIHTKVEALGAENKPDWCRTPSAGYFRIPSEGGEHDCHYHDYNELYLICSGKAKILNGGKEYYVEARDIVCIKAGDEHDILEIYGDEDFELFWLYESNSLGGRLGHLHRTAEKAVPHPVPAKPIPPGFRG